MSSGEGGNEERVKNYRNPVKKNTYFGKRLHNSAEEALAPLRGVNFQGLPGLEEAEDGRENGFKLNAPYAKNSPR